ncbi:MAG: hypothetical protein V4565_00115 [Bacteroidota bacterium]
MHLLKKIGFWLFVVASIAIAVWGYLRLKESKAPKISVLDHIPENAMCVIETKNSSELISQLTRQNLIWNSLLTQESMQVAQNGIYYLDSLVNSQPDIAEVLKDNSLYWSFIKEENNTEHLLLFKVKEKSEDDLFMDFFKKVFIKDNSLTSFDAFYFTNNKQKWIVSYQSGIVYMSSDFSVLERCLKLKKEESISENINYLKLIELNGEQKTQVYFDHSQTPLLSRDLFSRQSLFGAEVQLNAITLTGYSLNDSLSLFNCLKNQDAETFTGIGELPENPLSIQGVTLSQPDIFYTTLQHQLSEMQAESNNNAWKVLNDSALYNIQKETYENIDQEILSANYVLNETSTQLISVKIKDNEKGKFLLKVMSDSVLGENEFRLDKDLSQIFSFSKSDFKMTYGCISGNSILLFADRQLFNYYQASRSSNQLLKKNSSFTEYINDNLSLECNYFYYEDSELMKINNENSVINSEILWSAQNPTSQISITAKNYKDAVQVRLNASHAQPKTNGIDNTQNSLWAFNSDSLITSDLNVFVNHMTQENELCFQDASDNMYLINSTGNLIWKMKITEALQSTIYTVDIFKNGKLQLLFSTQNFLHLLDRNGNYVKGFPVKLPAKATSGLTVLDYGENKDYRLFIACADKRIYNFSLYGIKTEGFIPVKTEAEVIQPVQYVKVGGSDYLVTVDVSGKIYVFSRKGEGRIDFKNKVIEQLDHLLILPGNNLDHTKLVYVDDKNNLMNKISFTDKKETLKIGDELSGFKTFFGLLNDDSQPDLLIYGSGALYAYDLFTGKLLEYINELASFDDAQLVHATDHDVILGFDKTAEKIDVINTVGKLSATFPNVSRRPMACDLYKNGKTYVLLVTANSISCRELN